MAQQSVLLPRVGAVGWRPLLEGTDQALIPEIEGTVGPRSMWADANATTITMGGGAANTTVNIGAGAAVTAIQIGGAAATVTIPGNLTINGTTTTVEATTTTNDPTTTSGATTTTTEVVAQGLVVTIESVEIVGGVYSVVYSTNYEPVISSDPSTNHIHFFFDTVEVSQAGVPGSGPWILYDSPAPFTGYSVADRPEGASRMCATAASSGIPSRVRVTETQQLSCPAA